MEVTKWLKPSGNGSHFGDSASVQAATRVNAEQASKRSMCRPTRPPNRGRLLRPGEMSEEFQSAPDRPRAVADYIAGMTDRFALREHQRLTGRTLFEA